MSVKYYGEYGCPMGKWHLSMIIQPKFSMDYNGQRISDLRLPIIDCVKDRGYKRVCDDCPLNGQIESNLIKMWETL